MKAYLKNLALGIPLALGAMLTLVAVSQTLEGGDNIVSGLICGVIGIPLLFATLAPVLKQE